MFDLRRRISGKALAVLLSVFFLMEAHVLYAQQTSALTEQQEGYFKAAREAYFAGQYENAKTILEKLIADLETVEGRDTFKGETYLLAGAVYEKLDLLGPSVKYYCRAKTILGEGKSIEGLKARALKYYGANCAAISGVLAEMEGQSDELVTRYNQARIGYFAGAYEAAKATLESLITSLGAIEGRDTFKGQVYLLAGAVYEVLAFRELSVKYYCWAKRILGEGTTIESLKLEDLKYYKEPCGASAVAGKAVNTAGRHRKGIGGLVIAILSIAVVGGLIWYLFFSKNAPLGKKGKYKNITFRVDVTYRGVNSSGHRRLTVGSDAAIDENFYYPQVVPVDTPPCNGTKEETYSKTYTVTGSSLDVKQEFLNWDYIAYNPAIVNYKGLCAEFTPTIVRYEYENGKDPGTPICTGLENLNNIGAYDCAAVTGRIKNCLMTTKVTFSVPSSMSAARASSSAYVEMSDKK
ncbi:MAG: hypothetical protein ACYDH3_03635 [Candidatus Aminicenantales bacterium]